MRAKHFFCTAVAVALAAQFAQARVIEIHTFNGPSRKPVAVEGVTLSVADTMLSIGATLQLTASILPANATNKNVEWESSNTTAATVGSNGMLTALDTGSTIITATADGGKKTVTCTVKVCFLIVDNIIDTSCICFAAANIADSGEFAIRPDMYTQFYQFSRNKPWAATGNISSSETWETYLIANQWLVDPCPQGWRLPTHFEYEALCDAGSTWIAADDGTRGNDVAGRFFGVNHATCSLSGSMRGCVFFPASGFRNYTDGTLNSQGDIGCYWSRASYGTVLSYRLAFDNSASNASNYESEPSPFNEDSNRKTSGNNVRCVRDIP